MGRVNINAYGEIQNDPDLAYELIYDGTNDKTFKKRKETVYTKTITVTSAQILTCGSVPVILLESPGIGKYYDWEAIVKYHFVSTAYSMGSPFSIQQGTINKFPFGIIAANTQNAITFVRPGFNGAGVTSGYAFYPNNPLSLSTLSGPNPTTGDGYLTIILKYKIKTF